QLLVGVVDIDGHARKVTLKLLRWDRQASLVNHALRDMLESHTTMRFRDQLSEFQVDVRDKERAVQRSIETYVEDVLVQPALRTTPPKTPKRGSRSAGP